MLNRQNPTQTLAWKALETHFSEVQNVSMYDLFTQQTNRFENFSIAFEDILFDFSKNRLTQKTLDLLLQLAAKQS